MAEEFKVPPQGVLDLLLAAGHEPLTRNPPREYCGFCGSRASHQNTDFASLSTTSTPIVSEQSFQLRPDGKTFETFIKTGEPTAAELEILNKLN